jgi:hypothetical protein
VGIFWSKSLHWFVGNIFRLLFASWIGIRAIREQNQVSEGKLTIAMYGIEFTITKTTNNPKSAAEID